MLSLNAGSVKGFRMNMPEEVLFDVRLVERHIRKGLTTTKDHQKFVKAQEDLEGNLVTVDYEQITATGAHRTPAAE